MPQTAENTTDVVIIGGGPAGMSAALWCCDLGLKAVLIEKNPELGGQLLQIYNPITNYLGLPAANGRELRDEFELSLAGLPFERCLGDEVISVDWAKRRVYTAAGREFHSRAIIIATGVRRRKLGIEGEEEFVGKGILSSGAKEKALVTGKTVAIIGGGDAALENALILAEHAEKIYVLHRRSGFRARSEFLELAKNHPRIELRPGTIPHRIAGTERLNSIGLTDVADGSHSEIPCDYVLIRIGVEPNSGLFRDQLRLDPSGYIRTDSRARTSFAGVHAVGDVANPSSPTISTATGNASTAAKVIYGLIY